MTEFLICAPVYKVLDEGHIPLGCIICYRQVTDEIAKPHIPISNFSVTNDTAKRGVALIHDFNRSTNEELCQDLLLTVQKHRDSFLARKLTKSLLSDMKSIIIIWNCISLMTILLSLSSNVCYLVVFFML